MLKHQDVKNISGEFFSNKKMVPTTKNANDENVAERLWQLSEKLTNLN